MSLITVAHLVQKDLDQIDQLIHDTLLESEYTFTREILDYLLSSSGKKIRPILTLLSFYCIQPNPSDETYSKLIKVCAAIEIIHMASLVHDDVIDDGKLRRMKETINVKWGTEVAVVLGVFLYSVSLKLIYEVGSMSILSYLSTAVFSMCQGELIQLSNRFKDYNKDDYYSVIAAKTADLFSAASLSGALLADGDEKQLQQFKLFSQSLGMLFQISDDYLDLKGFKNVLKKESGQDMLKGIYTLPMHLLLDTFDADEMIFFNAHIASQSAEFLAFLKRK